MSAGARRCAVVCGVLRRLLATFLWAPSWWLWYPCRVRVRSPAVVSWDIFLCLRLLFQVWSNRLFHSDHKKQRFASVNEGSGLAQFTEAAVWEPRSAAKPPCFMNHRLSFPEIVRGGVFSLIPMAVPAGRKTSMKGTAPFAPKTRQTATTRRSDRRPLEHTDLRSVEATSPPRARKHHLRGGTDWVKSEL